MSDSGDEGRRGPRGPEGVPGATGAAGAAGAAGATGAAALRGPRGETGPQGRQGKPGPAGDPLSAGFKALMSELEAFRAAVLRLTTILFVVMFAITAIFAGLYFSARSAAARAHQETAQLVMHDTQNRQFFAIICTGIISSPHTPAVERQELRHLSICHLPSKP